MADGMMNLEERVATDGVMKVTPTRLQVARYLDENPNHPDMAEICAGTGIAEGTVYRILNLFVSRGWIRQHEFGDYHQRYDKETGDNHGHIIMPDGKILDMPIDSFAAAIAAAGKEAGVLIGKPVIILRALGAA